MSVVSRLISEVTAPKIFRALQATTPTRPRWKILSLGYFDQQIKRDFVIQNASKVTPVVDGNSLSYSQVFPAIDVRYTCQNIRFNEEFDLSQHARKDLPEPTQRGIAQNNAYLMMAVEFILTPANIKIFARRQTDKTPVKQGNIFAFEGDEPIDFEDADSTPHFFFPKDDAYAVGDSTIGFAGCVNVTQVFYSKVAKDYITPDVNKKFGIILFDSIVFDIYCVAVTPHLKFFPRRIESQADFPAKI